MPHSMQTADDMDAGWFVQPKSVINSLRQLSREARQESTLKEMAEVPSNSAAGKHEFAGVRSGRLIAGSNASSGLYAINPRRCSND